MIRDYLRAAVNKAIHDDAFDLKRARQRLARDETAKYIENHLPLVQSVANKYELLDLALRSISVREGITVEFGVFSGRTINHIAKKEAGKIFGFDSFEGLPEDWREGYLAGSYRPSSLPKVPQHVTLVKGLFDDSLPPFLQANAEPFKLAHIDCDLYSSTKTIFSLAEDRFVSGTIIVFDEFWNYPGWREGEFRAFEEFINLTGKSFSWLAYNRYHEQAAVRID